ncbi:conserved hypothetical protein [Leishmania major strain Friedlin]|uniref:CHCH domain-containing protein n=1 Tax=Leishmania major TaxID=5664 RepID=Q9NED6_LEIMA|nr:conserved hypothetical protein [Leishmania major strain Friedlin]CAB75565.1 conserved hypothetical protein [Leishmania major strain Friedlin]CAG9567743.1 hypothetical_protein_-_conserved [Leishmania major strain Friedlin]|eukprot:XP_888560.1 conserved hypothetical protein [Leishmania major strain Friedlin]
MPRSRGGGGGGLRGGGRQGSFSGFRAERRPGTTSHPPQPNGVTNIYVQRPMAGGGGSGILGTMAAVAGGSVLGHGISNYLYGHSNQAPTQPAEAQQLAQAAQQEGHVCTPQLVGYSKCLEANPESADSCKWAWDYFTQCQREHPMQPPQ